jgi:epsin
LFRLDDFDDFQSAPTVQQHQPSSSTTAPPKKANDIFDLLGEDNAFTSSPVAPQQSQQPQAQSLMLSQGISFDILTANSNTSSSSIPHQQSPAIQPLSNPSSAQPAETENKPTIGGIWSGASNLISLDSLGTKATPTKPAQGPSMNSLKNSSANAGWNNWASANPSPNNQQQQQQQQKKQTSAFDDLLF